MAKKLFIKTYGCQMNVYDSGRMAEVLAPMGYEPAASPEGADMVVLNTCPHPLHPGGAWQPRPVHCAIHAVPAAADDDPCRTACAENGRGFANTAHYHCQCAAQVAA